MFGLFFKKEKLQNEVNKLQSRMVELEESVRSLDGEIRDKQSQIVNLDDLIHLQDVGLYEKHFNYENNRDYAKALSDNLQRQKYIIKQQIGLYYNANSMVLNNSRRDGKKIINEYSKNMLCAFNACCDNWASSITVCNFEKTIDAMRKKFDKLNSVGELLDVSMGEEIFSIRAEEMALRLEVELIKCEEKEKRERQREILREQEKSNKEIEEKILNIQKELDKKRKEYSKHPSQELSNQINELKLKVNECNYRLSNSKAGNLYIISNDDMLPGLVKIGVSRRIDPMQRITELSNASHAYKFKVHGMIFSDDVFTLENKLHKKFAYCRVNQPNYHKEFFKVSLDEIEHTLQKDFNISVHLNRDVFNEDYLMSKEILNES